MLIVAVKYPTYGDMERRDVLQINLIRQPLRRPEVKELVRVLIYLTCNHEISNKCYMHEVL